MTLKPTPAALRLELSPSRTLLTLLCAAHLLALAAAMLAPVSPPITALVAVVTLISFAFHSLRLCHPRWRIAVLGRDEQGWWLQCGGRRQHVGLRACWVSAHAVGMMFRGRSLLVFGDACNAEAFRRLRVQLRFAPGLENGVAGLG